MAHYAGAELESIAAAVSTTMSATAALALERNENAFIDDVKCMKAIDKLVDCEFIHLCLHLRTYALCVPYHALTNLSNLLTRNFALESAKFSK